MAETDWTELADDLSGSSLDRGVTTGIARPAGGGSFIYGFNSLDVSVGAAGLFTNQAGFAPTDALKGGSIRGAVQRGVSAGDKNFSPFLFIQGQGTSVNDICYMLGLSDNEPHKIVLAKSALVSGVPGETVDPTGVGVLSVSSGTFTKGTWLHLRLDCIVNVNGDVLLQCFRNDLGSNDVDAPAWVVEPGLANVVDDALQILTGSAALTAGRMGFGFQTKDVSRRGFFDHIEAFVQS